MKLALWLSAALLCAPAGALEKAVPPSLVAPQVEGLAGPLAPIPEAPPAAPPVEAPSALPAGVPAPCAVPAPALPAPLAAPAQPGPLAVASPAARLSETLEAAKASAAATVRAVAPQKGAEGAAASGGALFDGAKPGAPAGAGELGVLAGATLAPVAKNVFHLNFPTQHLLAATFLRFQEHYESPKYAGKSFTWEEFMDWYAAQNGKFSYFEDWSGFNIPSRVLRAFYKGAFDPLTRKEKALLDVFRGVKGRFYIIGTSGSVDDGTLRHEIAHGLFYRDRLYRRRVREVLKTVDLKPVYKALTEMGYGPNVLEDEAHAYLGDDLADLKKRGVDVSKYRAVHEALLALYRAHGGR